MQNAPTAIDYKREQRTLFITWPDQTVHQLSAEYLRVHSPSAEVRGHGVGQEVLQVGKKDVGINDIEQAGRYALKITFDDGHNSGLFDWTYLRTLGEQHDVMWPRYLKKLADAGAQREPMFISVKQL